MHSRFFFFNDTATTEIYTLSLHDALPILMGSVAELEVDGRCRLRLYITGDTLYGPHLTEIPQRCGDIDAMLIQDRKSTRLNSSHANISYAVFCLKKKKKDPAAFPHLVYCE